MEPNKSYGKGNGGRPTKAIKSNHFIGVKCSLVEKIILKQKAKQGGLTLSEYLRNAGLNRKVDRKIKVLPKEILQFTGTLNHLAANLNQLAKKRNHMDELSVLERIQLQTLSNQVKEMTSAIKAFIQ